MRKILIDKIEKYPRYLLWWRWIIRLFNRMISSVKCGYCGSPNTYHMCHRYNQSLEGLKYRDCGGWQGF